MTDPPKIAFKLFGSKRPNLNLTSQNQFDSAPTAEHQVELVTGFNNGELQSTTPRSVKEELVIPSQPNVHHRFLHKKMSTRPTTTTTTTTSAPVIDEVIDQIDDEAKRALILEAQAANDAWTSRNENGTTRVHAIEQKAENTFAVGLGGEGTSAAAADGGQDEEEKEVENADYDQVPIEDFGMAVLRGMGYKEDAGLGISNRKQVDVFVPELRPRGLGLGADRKVLEKVNELKRNLKKAGIDEKEDLCMEKGAFVLIEKGPHADQYGTIEWIEEDVSRLTVALAVTGTNKKKETISISQYNVKLVTEKEFLKYSKYVNKSKADRVEQETSEKLMKEYRRDDDSKRHRSSKYDDDDRRDRDRDRHRDRDRDERYKSSRRH